MLADRDEARRQHRIRRDSTWHAMRDVIAGYIELSQAQGLDMTAARIAWTLNRRTAGGDRSAASQAPRLAGGETDTDAEGASGRTEMPTSIVPVGLYPTGRPSRRRRSAIVAALGGALRWAAGCAVAVGVFWVASEWLPLETGAGQTAMAAGLGLAAWKGVMVIFGGRGR
jgi:hypothetical protein